MGKLGHSDPNRKTRRIDADKGGDSAEQHRRREDVLRPWPSLGYDRDRIAMHMLSVEAFGVAESELRRAVWLNPYEPRFKVHLAWCLCREKRYADAQEWVEQVPADCLPDTVAQIKRIIEESRDEGK